MSQPLELLAAGRIYADLVMTGFDSPPRPGREVFASGLVLTGGGGAYITASFAAALGAQAGLFGILPAAPFDRCLQAGMRLNRVADYTSPAPADTEPQLTVAAVYDNDRSFLTRRVGAALDEVTTLPVSGHLHISEITTALEHPDLIDIARARGMSVSLDCGWDELALSSPDIGRIISLVDIFLPNEVEAAFLAANHVSAAPKIATVIKCGAGGSRGLTAGSETVARTTAIDAIDPTGAGDAFNAGFILAWRAGHEIATCLQIGNTCGAEAVSRIGGALDLPDLSHLFGSSQT